MGEASAHAKGPAPALTRTIADALFSRTQQRVFSLVFGQPERAFVLSELIALAGSGTGAVQREVQKLLDSKLIVATTAGRQKHYQRSYMAPALDSSGQRARVEAEAGADRQSDTTAWRASSWIRERGAASQPLRGRALPGLGPCSSLTMRM